MKRPTIEKIDEIIDKLSELQTTIATIKDKPLDFPENQEKSGKSLSIAQLINVVGQKSAGESIDTLAQVIKKSIDGFSSYPQNSNQATTQVLARLPSLSQSMLKKLLKDDIPKLLADDRISKVKKQVWHGESPFTEEAQNLHFVRKEIDKQIQENIEAAKERRWNKHIQPLRDEIDILFSPYSDFLQKYIMLDIDDLSLGNTSPLDKLIHEFKKIRYRIKTEAEQPASQKPLEAKGDLVSQLLKYIDTVLDDIRQLEDCQSRNSHVDKYIRTELVIAFNETKKLAEKIFTDYPEIKDMPTKSDDPKEYLKNTHRWCVEQLHWEDGKRIGAEKTPDSLVKVSAETVQKKRISYTGKKVCKIILSIIVVISIILGVIWTFIQIYESDTFKNLFAQPRIQEKHLAKEPSVLEDIQSSKTTSVNFKQPLSKKEPTHKPIEKEKHLFIDFKRFICVNLKNDNSSDIIYIQILGEKEQILFEKDFTATYKGLVNIADIVPYDLNEYPGQKITIRLCYLDRTNKIPFGEEYRVSLTKSEGQLRFFQREWYTRVIDYLLEYEIYEDVDYDTLQKLGN